MSAARVLVYVQHLLGTGHLKRAALLADAMTRAGLDVTLVSGGFPVPGLAVNAARFVQLPPVGAADAQFKSLVDAQGRPVDEAWKRARCAMLLDVWNAARAQLLLVELFPFGRRQMRFELLPLLEAARQAQRRPVIVSSVRDVLGGSQKDAQRQLRMLELFDAYFDHVLVHGDPALVPFEQTFMHADRLAGRLHYTGYVVDGASDPELAPGGGSAGGDEVIVSAGGGTVGRPLLEAAIRARPLSALAHLRWRILVGAGLGDAVLQELAALATHCGGDVVVERNRPDFVRLLRSCRLSLSQAGYNTLMETLHAGARAVVVPFAGGSESEQTLRARLLAQRGWIEMVEETDMTPQTLAGAVDRAAAREPPARGLVRLDGADASARLVMRWLAQRST